MFLLELAKAFKNAKIPYAVVGGYAVALHGAVRGTVDIDIILKFSVHEFVAAEQTLKDLGLESKLPVSATEVFNYREEYIKNRNLVAWSFFDPRKPINQLDIIISDELQESEIETVLLHHVPVSILSKRALILMKKKSGRPQDLADVHALEELIREK